ncbi:class F sortase [Streptacidiphilus sp. PAMC 29251]
MARHAKPRSKGRLAAGSLVLLGAASAVGGAVGLGATLEHRGAPGGTSSVQMMGGASTAGAAVGPVVAQSKAPTGRTSVRPRSLSIPALKVRSSLGSLGLSSTGALDVPSDPAQAGWFNGGPVPGQAGPAVIVGHVDSRTGPGVFADLRLLRIGDVITIALSNGSSVRFQVTSIQHYPKDDFPTADVYGGRPDPELRLITCGGPFKGQEYLDNVVVYARLA